MTDLDTIRRAVNGVLMPGFNGTTVPDWLANTEGLASVLLFGHNTPDAAVTAAVTAELNAIIPGVIIAADEEGGDVTRIQAATGSLLPGACALGAVGETELTGAAGRSLGDLLRAVGVDLAISPVIDVASRDDNPVIGVRSFGADPAAVGAHGVAFAQGIQAAGVAACAKHFPGHGDTGTDSHVDLPILEVTPDLLRERDLAPFQQAFDAGVETIMVGHLRVAGYGDTPASLNGELIGLARAMGFTGVVISDALDMGALAVDPGFEEACVQAILAGSDLLCLGNTAKRDDEEMYHLAAGALIGAVQDGRLTLDRLAESAARVTALRDRILGLRRTRAAVPTIERANAAMAQVGRDVATRALALPQSVRGRVAVQPGGLLADLRHTVDFAAGNSAARLPGILADRLGLTLTRDPEAVPALVVTRAPNPAVAELLTAHPEIVVVHTGVPGSAPREARNLVQAYGGGVANAEAAAAVCKP
ncbi:hypothetical protein GCG21_09795 [Pseudactinotalea sp. HY160]|uniref:glycoside hydrolase family 3 protein n=1 Tax=Pseudactinotalea sp. HY160 TaxID=2654490 RepID=UPI00128E17F4|nr:glycoside hydrolase family 3 N-terminal domain-containing protein [Pseudactinotalea sp. HY160]MPV50289.1 hypothetical protein [Pseudactinotalea sp. HY160]